MKFTSEYDLETFYRSKYELHSNLAQLVLKYVKTLYANELVVYGIV